ncbi:MAG TPA: hypothetical protein VIB39_01055 [Candidatus Angelobacter sp.]|jgi:hypothetical protein
MSEPGRKQQLSDELGFNIEEFSIVELEDRLEFTQSNTGCGGPAPEQPPPSNW